jgi:hypothetical protein
LIYKGEILKAWGKKQAVVLHEGFFNKLPPLPTTDSAHADIAWLIYGLELDAAGQRYRLVHRRTEYTTMETTLERLMTVVPGTADIFRDFLENGERPGFG